MLTKRILFFLFFICFAFSCEKEYYTTIPNYDVRLELNLATLDFELKTHLAYKTITEQRAALDRLGFGGILIINSNVSPFTLYAFDLACPVEAKRDILIIPDNMNSPTSAVKTAITATCPKCGAVYNIISESGRPQSGSKYFLRAYRVSGNGTNFTIHN